MQKIQSSPDWLFGHNTNNLPLALKPIIHVSNTDEPTMAIMLLLRKGLCQRITNVAIYRNPAYPYI
ncbi:hypothetical protein, partial [Escherichia coli]|uniref:hypothetical protein n=1 Tax=Escherichia coli TaxID=562 RepID=UPI00200C149E